MWWATRHGVVIGILSYYEFWKNLPRSQNALCAKINIESFQEFRILNQKSFLLGFCWEFKNQFSPNCSDGSPEAWGTQGSSWNVWILGLTEFNLNSSLDFRNLFRISVLERFSENCKILENILVIHSRKEWLLPCCVPFPFFGVLLKDWYPNSIGETFLDYYEGLGTSVNCSHQPTSQTSNS